MKPTSFVRHQFADPSLYLIVLVAAIVLRVQYPEDYPDVAPNLDISNSPNHPKHKHLDVHEDKARLLESLLPTIEENMGMAMIFTLVSTLKDSAELLISERQQSAQAIRDVEAAKAEEEENKKFHGTAVTRETFLKWRAEYNSEMEEAGRRRIEEQELEDKKRRIVKEEKRLTGKQLWERGMVGKVDEEEQDDEEDVDLSVKGLEINS